MSTGPRVPCLVMLGCTLLACGESRRDGRERAGDADTGWALEDARHFGADTGRSARGEWVGFRNNTSPQDRDAELRAHCAASFRRVSVPQRRDGSDVTFGALCRSIGATCTRVCDWEGHVRSCEEVSQRRHEAGRDLPWRDGSRIAYCASRVTRAASSDTAHPRRAPGPPPAWLTALIQKLEHEPVANPPASIIRYRYRGADVYYLPPRCCDVPGVLYDTAGAVVCLPDGGITGKGDGRCTDFAATRSDETVIWRDRR